MKKTLESAFVTTLPVLFGYLFTGIAFGLLLSKAGYGVLWVALISTVVYAGSMQFVLVTFFDGGLSLFTMAMMTFAINIRHSFYGLSFIQKFKEMGKRRLYMIFSLTDETYSLLCSAKTPKGVDEKQYYMAIALMDQIYWIIGSVLGSVAGALITFDTTGIDFAMTALFIVIFVEQWLEAENHLPALVGLAAGIVCLLIFGPGSFILPSLLSSVLLLMLLKARLDVTEKAHNAAEEQEDAQ